MNKKTVLVLCITVLVFLGAGAVRAADTPDAPDTVCMKYLHALQAGRFDEAKTYLNIKMERDGHPMNPDQEKNALRFFNLMSPQNAKYLKTAARGDVMLVYVVGGTHKDLDATGILKTYGKYHLKTLNGEWKITRQEWSNAPEE